MFVEEAHELLRVASRYAPRIEGLMHSIVRAYEARTGKALKSIEDQPKARATDPLTSKAASALVEPSRGSQRARLLLALWGRPQGLDAPDLSGDTRIPLNSASTRLSELDLGGFVKVVRHAQGRSVYALTDKGVETAIALGRE